MFGRDKSVKMSAPKSYILYGVKIRKLPVGKYVQVMEAVNNLPAILLDDIFPDTSDFGTLIAQLNVMKRDEFLDIFGKILSFAPKRFCMLLSDLLDIPQEWLLDPECENALSLKELAEVVQAFVELNDLTDFFVIVRSIKQRLSARTNTGSSAG